MQARSTQKLCMQRIILEMKKYFHITLALILLTAFSLVNTCASTLSSVSCSYCVPAKNEEIHCSMVMENQAHAQNMTTEDQEKECDHLSFCCSETEMNDNNFVLPSPSSMAYLSVSFFDMYIPPPFLVYAVPKTRPPPPTISSFPLYTLNCSFLI